jgi:gamma-D-glutamyl-L-lysine dipeptidyl-peptidase
MKAFMQYTRILFFSIFLGGIIYFSGCNKPVNNYFVKEIDSISKKWVPDKREGICDVRIFAVGPDMILKGETDLPEAKEAFLEFLNRKNVVVLDSLRLLPDTVIIKEPWGLVNVSVCNIRLNPSHDAEMVSQSIMGTPVKILRKSGGWFMIQTPDLYLGWVDGDGIEPISSQKFKEWKASSRIIYLNKFGDIFSDTEEKNIVSDIVVGSLLELKGEKNGYCMVALPDGRQGFISKSYCEEFTGWSAKIKPEAGKVLSTAYRFMGTPYLWGGTSSKGLDCSGFVKTAYYLNGLILARDVSLQFRHGLSIKATLNPDSLKAGDLLFFGSKRNGRIRPTHVGMYIGDTEFIHESGMVRINSLDSTRANFSRYRRDTFLGVRRIIGETPGKGFQSVYEHSWYK